MCRWMAWLGQPVLIDELLFKTPARDRGPEPARPHGRRADQRRRLRARLVRHGRGPGASTTASRRRGRTRTCASWRRTSTRRCSSRTCARRSARRCSRPTAIRSATGSWLFVHNGYIARLPRAPARPDAGDRAGAVRRRPRLDRHRGRLPPRAHVRARGGPDRRAGADRRADRGDRRPARRRGPGAGQLRRLGRRPACGRCATRPMGARARCSPRRTSDSVRRLHPDNARVAAPERPTTG